MVPISLSHNFVIILLTLKQYFYAKNDIVLTELNYSSLYVLLICLLAKSMRLVLPIAINVHTCK